MMLVGDVSKFSNKGKDYYIATLRVLEAMWNGVRWKGFARLAKRRDRTAFPNP